MASASITTSTIGFPRIGPNREMKKALERYSHTRCVDHRTMGIELAQSRSLIVDRCLDCNMISNQSDVCYCSYWKKQLSLEDLLKVNDQTEKDAWQLQSKTGTLHSCRLGITMFEPSLIMPARCFHRHRKGRPRRHFVRPSAGLGFRLGSCTVSFPEAIWLRPVLCHGSWS